MSTKERAGGSAATSAATVAQICSACGGQVSSSSTLGVFGSPMNST